MILAIDVGNTNIVLGLIEGESILNFIRLKTDVGATEAEYVIKISQLLEFYKVDPESIDGSILSSVVPPVTEAMKRALKTLTGREPMVVGPGMKTGLNIRIDDPGTVAADLIVGSVAALHEYGAPAIVIDLGTAMTMTVLDENGSFLGGVIYPGIKLSYGALSQRTSLLPEISIQAPPRVIGSNTVDCMRSGAVYGTAALIDGLIERMEAELGYSCKVIATGGLANGVVQECRREIISDGDLLMKGLRILYEKNKK